MGRAEVPDVDPATLPAAVDAGSYVRGVRYAGQGAVVQLRWEPSQSALQGLVRGSSGGFYTTIAYLSPGRGPGLSFSRGVCSCPVATDCKHVVALVLTAAGTGPGAGSGGGPGPRSPLTLVPQQAPAAEAAPAWAASLDSLLEPPEPGAGQQAAVPLAIELTLVSPTPASRRSWQGRPEPAAGPPRLTARLMQARGARWVAGSLSWSKLDSLQFYGSYSPAQVRALHEIYALSRYGGSRVGYYSYGDEKYIDLGLFPSRQLWPLLDEAQSAGLRLVQRGRLGDVPEIGTAEVVIDVTSPAAGGGLVIASHVDGLPEGCAPVRFIGGDGHGLVYARRTDIDETEDCGSWHIGLARLARPVPAQLQRLVLAGHRLEIPGADRARFRDGYYPRLRRAAPVISSDGSFTAPVISGPTLLLRASYLAGHQVDIGWDWAYQVGDSRLRRPADVDARSAASPDRDAMGYGDLAAERAIIAGLDGPLLSLGLVRPGQDGPALVPGIRLDGIETMRFSTEVLPLLAGQPGVAVEVSGEVPDYREASDSLRIGVSASAIDGDADWFDLGITISVDGRGVPFSDVFVALSRGEPYLLLPDGAYFALDKPELQALSRLIAEARALQDGPAGDLRISRFQAGLWDELTELGVVASQAAAWREQVAGLLSVGSVEPRQPPATLRAQLRPYQLDGYSWLAFLWEHQLGGILADDMGLGKTLQALALICHARQEDPAGPPFLIVAPTSVVPNWAAEAARFAPGLKVAAVQETDARRGQPLRDLVAGADAVVTSYALLRIDIASYAAVPWSGLILDEAQFAKNHQSKVYQCARRLPARFKLAITGTPMENNLMELWALLSITAPGLFPSPDRFRDYYARPIEKSGQPELLSQLRRRIRPLVRRRTKEQVASDLPPKQEQVLEVDLHPRHRRLYQTHLQRERQKVLGLIGDLNANRFAIFRSLTLLRQLSLHAGLVDEAYRDVPSSKIDVLTEQLLDVVGGGHRALVFSQFTGFLAVVREELDTRGIAYCYLDGSTRNRAAVLERFGAGDMPVFLISLKAGGFGLNLTEADYCFLLDPWWNPATEAQAVDRTHRIGQTRNVMVYRLIARDTIEEKVMALKARKAQLFASVLDEGNVFGAGLDAADIRGLFD
jgi:superfamily II DNA or RNA helicase